MSDAPVQTHFETKDLAQPCRYCGRPLVLFQGVPMHASAWDEAGQREIYRHCRLHVADPTPLGQEPDDVVEREQALTAYFRGGDMNWEHPTVDDAAGMVAFRAGWRAARE